MSQTVTAVQAPAAIGRIDGHTNYASRDFVVTNAVTINAGDFVRFDGSGAVTNGTMTGDSRPIGMAEGTVTGTSTGLVTVTVCIDPNMLYLIKSSTSTFATTDVGNYYDLANANQILVSSKSSTTGAFILLASGAQAALPTPPTGIQGTATTSYGVFKLVESALLPLGS